MNRRTLLLRLGLMVPLTLAVAGATAWLVMSLSSGGREEVAVPDLRGLEMGAAIEAASKKELALALTGYAYDASVPARHVIAQTPEAGSPTRKNRILRVVVSRGSRSLAVPSLGGMNLRRAQLVLSQTGLTVGNISTVRAPGSLPGDILAQTPPAGTYLSRGEAVDLLLSGGPLPLLLVMEDLTALPLADGLRLLRGWKLGVGTILSQPRADLPPGTIIATAPPAGYPVEEGVSVSLTVSSAPR